MDYLALLGDPSQKQITRESWTVATSPLELPWAGWQPDSVLSTPDDPVDDWHALDKAQPRTTIGQMFDSAVQGILDHSLNSPFLGAPPKTPESEPAPLPPPGLPNNGLKDLATLERLHREESLGRVGWIFLAGSIQMGEDVIPCCFPLFERRVNFEPFGQEFFPVSYTHLTLPTTPYV